MKLRFEVDAETPAVFEVLQVALAMSLEDAVRSGAGEGKIYHPYLAGVSYGTWERVA